MLPGVAYRTPIQIAANLGNTGDGESYDTPVELRGDVKFRTKVENDVTGATITTWANIRLHPKTLLGDRPPAVGDLVTVGGTSRPVGAAELVPGPGTLPAYLELVAAEG